MRAIVTAGGTQEPIDDVRSVTNRSSGRLGAALARALAARGCDVLLLAGVTADVSSAGPAVRVERFGSAAELRDALRAATEVPPSLLFMAAAVADYSPAPAAGKIRSDKDELVVTMRRNPKLLAELRARCGSDAVLVGFKLLSGVDTDELVRVAAEQNQRNALHATFANDLSEVGSRAHGGWLVPAQGAPIRLDGTKAGVAAALADACLAWLPPTPWQARLTGPTPMDASFEAAGVVLRVARDMGLYPGAVVSHRSPRGAWITPHRARATITDDLVHGTPSGWYGDAPPSTDIAVHADLYGRLPDVDALLQIAGTAGADPADVGLFLDDVRVDGAVLEPPALVAALAEQAWSGRWDGGGFQARTEGGALVAVDDAWALLADWAEVRESALARLASLAAASELRPIFRAGRVIGALLRHPDHQGLGVWVHPDHRARGLGDDVAARLTGCPVLVDDACAGFFVERGWEDPQTPGIRTLRPPTGRGDLRRAASICLVDAVGRQVLLGQRKVGPWPGHWAFPGGSVEAGEDTLAAGLRELAEETGIELPDCRPSRQVELFVGADGRAFHLTCFVVPVLSRPAPVESDEISPRWVPLQEAAALRPMAAGARRVLRCLP